MTLDEAIKHCEEVVKRNENSAKIYPRPNKNIKGSGRRYNAYIKCAEEYKQIAEWLKELKQKRKYEDSCQYCKYRLRSTEDEPCVICSHNYANKFKDDGRREVNADENSN